MVSTSVSVYNTYNIMQGYPSPVVLLTTLMSDIRQVIQSLHRLKVGKQSCSLVQPQNAEMHCGCAAGSRPRSGLAWLRCTVDHEFLNCLQICLFDQGLTQRHILYQNPLKLSGTVCLFDLRVKLEKFRNALRLCCRKPTTKRPCLAKVHSGP